MKRDLYETITQQIIDALETGVKPWQCPWDRSGTASHRMPWNPRTGQAYRGVNIVLLWMAAHERGYATQVWLTLKQANELGGRVRRGEKSVTCYFYKRIEVEKETTDRTTGEVTSDVREVPMLRAFHVFNLDQINGVELERPTVGTTAFTPIEAAEALLANSGATIREGGVQAKYIPCRDLIFLPDRARFERAEDFYSVATHELTHWVGHPSRLARDFTGRFGDKAYAFEELVAEMGSAFLNAELGLDGDLQHASYINDWLEILSQDKRAIVRAASLASQAHQFLMHLWQPSDAQAA